MCVCIQTFACLLSALAKQLIAYSGWQVRTTVAPTAASCSTVEPADVTLFAASLAGTPKETRSERLETRSAVDLIAIDGSSEIGSTCSTPEVDIVGLKRIQSG